MAAFSPGYFLSRAASEGSMLASLYQSERTGSSTPSASSKQKGELLHLPCRSRISLGTPKARHLFPREDAEKPVGWSVPRYSDYVLCPEKLQRASSSLQRPHLEVEHLEKPNGWGVKRYAGPQVTRYVPDPYSDFVRPARVPGAKRGPGEAWMRATGRLDRAAEQFNDVPDGWSVPRCSPIFTNLRSEKCSFEGTAMGCKMQGVSPGKPVKVDSDRHESASAASGKVQNPLLMLKAAAKKAEQRRLEEAGDGVDVPPGWSVPRYAPKLAGLTADEMMHADPLGRPSCTANVWWGIPKAHAERAMKNHAGMDGVKAASRECRKLSAPLKST